MKNLPCLIAFSAISSLVLVTIASFLGVPFPYALVVSYLVGFSGAAGVLAVFLTDYAPRSADTAVPTKEAKRANKPAVQAVVRQRRVVSPTERTGGGSFTEDAMATLGLRNHAATLSLL